MIETGGYVYRAMAGDGRVQRGMLDASSETDACDLLERQGLFALDISRVRSPSDRRVSISAADLALGLRLLAELFGAGLSMTRALHTLSDVGPRSWQAILPGLQESIKEGKSLGASLRDAPAEIPALIVGMILAGEMAGDVAGAVRRAAELTEAMAETRAAIRNALAYPSVLAVAGSGAIALMVGVVIPRFVTILADLGQALPASTQLVINGSAALHKGFLPTVAASAALAVAIRLWTGTAAGRVTWHAFLSNIPVLGTVRRASSTARATFTLASLLESGVSLRQAIPFAARATADGCIEARIMEAAARIESGQAIAPAFRDCAAVTPIALRLIHAGEESGRLATMLRHAAKLEQDRSERITKTAVRLLEPALILIFSGVVALIAAALLQAVYSIRPSQ